MLYAFGLVFTQNRNDALHRFFAERTLCKALS